MNSKENPLMPLIRKCQRKRGLKSWVLLRMAQTGVSGNWANLSGWLHPDAKQRRIPHPETMAGLLKIHNEIKDKT